MIPPQFSFISWVTVREQAIVMTGNKFGVVGRGGQWVIPPEWNHITFLYDQVGGQESDPYFTVTRLLDASVQLSERYEDRSLELFSHEFHKGVIDWRGQTVIPVEWDYLHDLSEGVMVAGRVYKISRYTVENQTRLHRWHHFGLVRLGGEVLAEPVYDRVMPLRHGYTWMCVGERWGLLNARGDVVQKPWVTGLQRLSFNGYYKANRYGGWGVLRYDGALIIDFQWDDVRHVRDDIFEGRRNKQWHRIEIGGQILEKPLGKRIR